MSIGIGSPRTPKCRHCGGTATWHSKVSGDWLCGNCNPCWCNWCRGRVNAHGPEAVMLYRQQVDALSVSAISQAEPN